VDLVNKHQGTEVQILSGHRPGVLYTSLCDPAASIGTRITAS
jgi:hypothetical protein